MPCNMGLGDQDAPVRCRQSTKAMQRTLREKLERELTETGGALVAIYAGQTDVCVS